MYDSEQVQKSNLFKTEYRGTVYEYYLTGTINEASEYLELCNLLRTALPQDKILIRINSVGGYVSSASMISNAIEDSDATVVGIIECDCMSAATTVFLQCDEFYVHDATRWMGHTVSGGIYGKEHENYSSVVFDRRYYHSQIKKLYKGFYSDDELDILLKGEDIYFDNDEVKARLRGFIKERGYGVLLNDIEDPKMNETEDTEQVLVTCKKSFVNGQDKYKKNCVYEIIDEIYTDGNGYEWVSIIGKEDPIPLDKFESNFEFNQEE